MIFKMGYFVFISALSGLDQTRTSSQSDKSGHFLILNSVK